jgi:hypothetical protein
VVVFDVGRRHGGVRHRRVLLRESRSRVGSAVTAGEEGRGGGTGPTGFPYSH